MKKEAYVQPALAKHELLRDITATRSGHSGGHGGHHGGGWGGGWSGGFGHKSR